MSALPAQPLTFEQLRRTNGHGADYWSARDLQLLLGYSQWRRFEDAIRRAMTSCEQSGNECSYHFAGAGKPITGGKGAVQDVTDYHLSRFACYLIAQNGDPRKPAIAQAQKYFAVQTRRQELSEAYAADMERLELRKQAAEEFKALSGAAKSAGVGHRMFGVFHDAGYKGLYDGRSVEAIKAKKGIAKDDGLMDRMNATELAANQFRMTQARDKLARERIRGERLAIGAHETVGREVRAAIRRIGGTMPEDIPADEHIKLVEKRVKDVPPKLAIEGREAGGLLGPRSQRTTNGSVCRESTRHSLDADVVLLEHMGVSLPARTAARRPAFAIANREAVPRYPQGLGPAQFRAHLQALAHHRSHSKPRPLNTTGPLLWSAHR